MDLAQTLTAPDQEAKSPALTPGFFCPDFQAIAVFLQYADLRLRKLF